MRRLAPILLLSLLWPVLAPAGGAIVMEGDTCTMHIDFYSARFTAYQPNSRGDQEFCEDLPDTGLTVFVLDYLHPTLKDVPVDFRIIRNQTGQGRFATWEQVDAGGDIEQHSVYYHPPVVRSNASFQTEYEFSEPGEYIGIVTAGHPSNQQLYRAVFPFEVGGQGPWRPELALAVLGVMALYLWRRLRRPGSVAPDQAGEDRPGGHQPGGDSVA